MHPATAARRAATSLLTAVVLLFVGTGAAAAADFTVASCQADSVNFSTTAFTDFATRGMSIRRACNPEGPGIRGLVTANTLRKTPVARGSVAMAALAAPTGTTFTTFRWAGSVRRSDCRYALQIYAEVPNAAPVAIKNVRANQRCARSGAAQAAGYRSRAYNVTGATRIVQRVICIGGNGRKSCSGRKLNYIRTYKAVVDITDAQAPTATITPDTPLATGAWVRGIQPLTYDAQDNVGVRLGTAFAGDVQGGADQRSCTMATETGAFANATPCPNGPGHLAFDTSRVTDGTHQLAVQAQDAAGNLGTSDPITARIDNAPPARVDVAAEGGERWRSGNDFAVAWSNPLEDDRAPIVGAVYKVCSVAGSACSEADLAGDGLSRLPVLVPGPGEWTVSMWRRDAAGNADPTAASVPSTLRYDPEPPQVSFDALSATDPTLITASVLDKVSGLADGAIEISPVGSNTRQTLKTDADRGRLSARIEDAALPAGSYLLRAVAHDQARNEASSSQRADGQSMAVTLPLRTASALESGVLHQRIERETVRKHGKRRVTRRPVTELLRAATVRLGRRTVITSRLTGRDGQGIAGAHVQVLEASEIAPEHPVADLTTDPNGYASYATVGTTTRTLRFAYAGSPLILPAEASVGLRTPAVSTLRVDRARVLNGRSVTFSGRVASAPIPASGKLVQLEVQLSGRWQTFRTVRTDPAGNWSFAYRFARTRGIQWYRFRVELPREAGYPFAAGSSKSVRVRVRGRS